jgi:hypothetical protein
LQELERKKAAMGIKEQPKLTKKQVEAKHAQMAKEKEIRTRLQVLNTQVESACSLLKACLEGNPASVRLNSPALLKAIVPLMNSPLAAPHLVEFYLLMRTAIFVDKDPLLGIAVMMEVMCCALMFCS